MPLVNTQFTFVVQGFGQDGLQKALTKQLAAIPRSVRIVSMAPASTGTSVAVVSLIVVVEYV